MEQGRIPNRLKKYRRLAGFSQCEAAELLDLKNTSCISRWEKGKSVPSLRYIFKLSLLYRTHPVHLYPDIWQQLKKELQEKESSVSAKSLINHH
jgi:transcriptional regulator with XRE-family HTH domain